MYKKTSAKNTMHEQITQICDSKWYDDKTFQCGQMFSLTYPFTLMRLSSQLIVSMQHRLNKTFDRIFHYVNQLNHSWYDSSRQALFDLHKARITSKILTCMNHYPVGNDPSYLTDLLFKDPCDHLSHLQLGCYVVPFNKETFHWGMEQFTCQSYNIVTLQNPSHISQKHCIYKTTLYFSEPP